MARVVIDTNVPIVANGGKADGSRKPSVDCRIAAVEFLTEALNRHEICVDLEGAVQSEYTRHLNASGQPGVGDRFFQEVLNSAPTKIYRHPLIIGTNGEYVSLPDILVNSTFDRSDRKFAALSIELEAPVANCVDSDWVIHGVTLRDAGVSILHVCGNDKNAWYDAA